jgi:ABC-2 type transport system permease protein
MTSIATIPEIARVTLRQLLGRRRTLVLVLLSAVPVLLALLFRAAGNSEVGPYDRDIFGGLSLTIVLPLVAILFGSGAFSSEVDDGTIVYLLAKPVRRVWIVLAKALAAGAVAVLLTCVSTGLAGLIVLSPNPDGLAATESEVLAMFVGSVCYVALFLAVSLFTRRALVIGIGYMLVWEGALSVLLSGIQNLSIRQYALGAGTAIYRLPLDAGSDRTPLSADTAFVLATVLVVISLVVATWRLMRFELPGGD